MYPKLLAAYGIVFLLFVGYLYYLQRRVNRLQESLERQG
ncbi:MAG: CcmD family protein [Halobacteriales archaeon]|jgi:CcmD family protein